MVLNLGKQVDIFDYITNRAIVLDSNVRPLKREQLLEQALTWWEKLDFYISFFHLIDQSKK